MYIFSFEKLDVWKLSKEFVKKCLEFINNHQKAKELLISIERSK